MWKAWKIDHSAKNRQLWSYGDSCIFKGSFVVCFNLRNVCLPSSFSEEPENLQNEVK